MGPLKMMGAMMKDKNIENMVTTVEVFVSSLSSLMAVFTNYDGGEFCSGLIFGSTGATMLTNIAQTLVTLTKMGADKSPKAAMAALAGNANHENASPNGAKGASTIKGKFPNRK